MTRGIAVVMVGTVFNLLVGTFATTDALQSFTPMQFFILFPASCAVVCVVTYVISRRLIP